MLHHLQQQHELHLRGPLQQVPTRGLQQSQVSLLYPCFVEREYFVHLVVHSSASEVEQFQLSLLGAFDSFHHGEKLKKPLMRLEQLSKNHLPSSAINYKKEVKRDIYVSKCC